MWKWFIAVAFATVAVFSIYTVVTISVDSRADKDWEELKPIDYDSAEQAKQDEIEAAEWKYEGDYSDYVAEAHRIEDALGEAVHYHIAIFGMDDTDRTFYEPEVASLPDDMLSVINGLETLDPPADRQEKHLATIKKLKEVHETMGLIYELIRKEYMGEPLGDSYEESAYLQYIRVFGLMEEL